MKDSYIIGIIGAGNMGEALIRGLIRSQLVRPYEILASARRKKRLTELEKKYGIHTTLNNLEIVRSADTVILAVKPQDMNEMLSQIRPFVGKDHLLISIAAGVDIRHLKKILGQKPRLIRVMPNLPALVDEGLSAIYAPPNVLERYRRFAHQIFQAVGSTVDIRNEEEMDAITGLSGTGPAYLFALMEAFGDTAVKLGLSKTLAGELMLKTFAGAADMALQTQIPPFDLRAKVTSKKGTTWAAMKVFKKRRFWKIVEEAIRAATRRSRTLRKARN